MPDPLAVMGGAGSIKALLSKRLEELESLKNESREARETVELDQRLQGRLSRMDALQQQAMALAVNERREAEMARIKSALERLTAGDYGNCLNCEEEIEPKRLAHDPAALLCLACASR